MVGAVSVGKDLGMQNYDYPEGVAAKQRPGPPRHVAWRRLRARSLAVATAFIYLFTSIGTSFATGIADRDSYDGGLCPHHPIHTDDCGYVKADPGAPCRHVHDGACGYYGTPSDAAACSHVHDEACKYAEPTDGSPCGFVCDKCVTGWSWNDPNHYLTANDDGVLWLLFPDANANNLITRDILTDKLPVSVTVTTAAGTGSASLIWDLSLFPGEGAFNGTYMLSASFDTPADTNGYLLTPTAPALELPVFLGNGDIMMTAEAIKKYLNQWSFVDTNKKKIENNAITAIKGNLNEMNHDEIVTWLQESVLPTQIRGWSSPDASGSSTYNHLELDNDNPDEAKYETTADGPNLCTGSAYRWGFVNIDWKNFPGTFNYGQTYTLRAETRDVVSGDNTYHILVNSNDPADVAANKKDTSVNPDILSLSLTIKEPASGWPGPVEQVEYIPGEHKFINDWSYEENNRISGITLEDDHIYTGIMTLIPGGSSLTVEDIIKKLPARVRGSASYDEVLVKAGFQDLTGSTGTVQGYVPLTWESQDKALTDSVSDGDQLTFYAAPKYTPGYALRINSNDKNYLDSSGTDQADTLEADDILNLTVTVNIVSGSGHRVSPANPENVTVNLFDYWVETKDPSPATGGDILQKTDWHMNLDNKAVKRTGIEDWQRGINKGRLLLFGDGMIHAGLWNKGAGADTGYGKGHAGMQDIVKPVLVDGYPVVNTDLRGSRFEGWEGIADCQLAGDPLAEGDPGPSQYAAAGYDSKNPKNISDTVYNAWVQSGNSASLDYLFDPSVSHDNKESFTDVSGLFQLDSQGYYYYDMRKNFAEFDRDSNEFILYDAPATVRTDGQNSIGNFFPFNTMSQVFDGVSGGKLTSSVACSGNEMNHHLGMTVSVDFRQPADGMVNSGSNAQPMTFQFSGDDDVWVFIDDVLVLDMGGVHSDIYGIIDFATGSVVVGRSFNTKGIPKYDSSHPEATEDCVTLTNLRELFTKTHMDDSVEWAGNNPDTFQSNSTHTLKMFYMERGNYDSSLALKFNLQPMLPQQIKKVDQNGAPVGNVQFSLFPATEAAAGESGAITCRYTDSAAHDKSEFYMKKASDQALVTISTDADGSAQFRKPDGTLFNFASRNSDYYILHEVSAPDGYRTQPIDIVLYYNHKEGMLSVANKWTTGAYACSTAYVTGPFNEYSDGLIVAVPRQYKNGVWHPLYGSNADGFQAIHEDNREGILTAALTQIKNDYAD